MLCTAILLYGVSFLYGLTGSVTFEGIRTAGADLLDNGAFRLAVLFTLVGFGFKITAVPFHFALRTRPFSGSLALAFGTSVLFVIVADVLPFQLAGVFAEAAKVVTAGI